MGNDTPRLAAPNEVLKIWKLSVPIPGFSCGQYSFIHGKIYE
jgi:hypothetical protein